MSERSRRRAGLRGVKDDGAVCAHARCFDGALMNPYYDAEILSVHHWTDRLFSFTTTREDGFRFQSGQFVMIGLPVDGRPLMRAYSIASSPYESHLEFLSIKVPGGPLTSRLQHVKPGYRLLVGRKPTGT